MDELQLSKWWQTLLQRNVEILDDPSLPLIGLDKALVYYNLPALPRLGFELDPAAGFPSVEPGFATLPDGALPGLRRALFSHNASDEVGKWAEKLMRFCEVRYSTLARRAREKWRNKRTVHSNMLQLAAFLLDYGIQNRDYRYVNTVLKLGDLPCLLDRKHIARELNKSGQSVLPGLFQFRLVLLMEYALDQIRKGQAL